MTPTNLRILVHDFSGHPFQVQLSRALAGAGHTVHHVYCSSYTSGQGRLRVEADDPPTLAIEDISLDGAFAKYSPVARARHEVAYARKFAELVDRVRPDVVLESNDPLLAKLMVARHLRRRGIPWVFWLQDLYSVAMAGELARRLPRVGRLAGRIPLALEGRLVRAAAAVVPITADFDGHLDGWRVPRRRRHVIPNWAPVDEIRPTSGRSWADEQGLGPGAIALYAGTLGLKHDPTVLIDLADGIDASGAQVVVVSEGAGADHLREHGADRPNLHVLPFQPYDRLPEVFGSATVLLTILNGDAGVFSVPSKLLSYLCAGRPIVAAVPAVNQAAKVLEGSGGGVVVPPSESAALVEAVQTYLDDPDRARVAGERARLHAEAEFDITTISERFASVLVLATRAE